MHVQEKKIRSVTNNNYFNVEHLKKGLKENALKSGGITIISRFFDHSTQLIGAVVLARLLTPADFGLVAMVTAVSGFFLLFKDLGLTDATVQSDKLSQNQVSTLFWINLSFSIALMILFCISAPLIAYFYKEPKLTSITIVSSVSFILGGLSTQHIALLRRNMLFVRIACIEMAGAAGSTVVAIVMALCGGGYWSLVVRNIILTIMVAAGAWISCGWRPGKPVRRSGVGPMVKFGANSMGFYLVNYFARNADKALIGWKNGATLLGYYSRAFYLFIAPISQLAIPLQNVAVSALTKLRTEPEKYKEYYLKALGYLSFIGMPISAFTASVSKDIILLLLGRQWVKAADIFAILGWAAGIQILYSTQGWVYVSLGRADRWFRWGLIASIVTVAGFFIGLPFGSQGIAAAYTISLYILIGPGLWYAGKPIGLKLVNMVAAVWRYYISSIIAAFICWEISKITPFEMPFLRVLFFFAIYTISYLICIVLFFGSFSPIIHFFYLLKKTMPLKKR